MSGSNDLAPHPKNDEPIRDRAVRLFTFLRELTELRTATVRSLEQYEKVLWLSDIPREQGCHCIAWGPIEDDERSEIWLEIRKPRLNAPPKLPNDLTPWLDLREVEESSNDFPKLRERITETVPGEPSEDGAVEPRTVFKSIAECPEIKVLWEQYIEEKWWPWAEEDRRVQAVQRVYTDLFSIYQKQQRLGEAYEVVLALGYLTWRTPSGQEVKRHIITAHTNITFDATRGVITVGPAGEGAKPTLEQDMLEPQERPDTVEQNAIEQQVAEIGEAVWDGIQVRVALQGWVHAVSPRGNFDETSVHQEGANSDPRIHLAPALVLRKRTERSLLRVFQEIIEQLGRGESVPLGVKRLVTIIDDVQGVEEEIPAEGTNIKASSQVENIYFPHPANDEQLETVRKLSSRQGVLVQGPPGTGKSHTIANLVCHLLAQGQRVLVTSHTARALKVLQDKFPKAVSALCVMLLGDDLKAMHALEDSVHGITERFNSWDAARNQQLIAELEKQLDETRRAEASTLGELRAIREAETFRHPLRFDTYEGTGQAIARRLKEEEEDYSWLSVQPEEADEPPLSNAEALELLRLLREIDREREDEYEKETVDPSLLVPPTDFVVFVRREAEARARYEAAAIYRTHPDYHKLASAPPDQRKMLVERLSDLRTTYEPLARHMQSWVGQAALQILTDQDRAWRELLTATREHLAVIGNRARWASEFHISGLGERQRAVVKAQAAALMHHLEAGGRLGFGPFRPPFRPKVVAECRYLIKEVRVDGQLCDTPERLKSLLEWLEIAERITALRRRWSPHIEPPTGSFSEQVAQYENYCALLERVLGLQEKREPIRGIIATVLGLTEPAWHDPNSLHALEEAAAAVTFEEERAQAQSAFNDLERSFRAVSVSPNAHRVVNQTLEAIKSRDERGYAEAHQALWNLQRSRGALQRRRDLFQRLEVVTSALASRVALTFADEAWDCRLAKFTEAWNWARADIWLKRLSDPQRQEGLAHALERHRLRLRELIRDLAAAKAWGSCFARLKEPERQHLMAWKDAVRRVGKGTGKYATMHRRAAREHMEQCRSAIPAWIMPLYRVAETIRPGTEAFDVVIVDEASQSGPEALFLHYLARKVVVVGDDKQISPEFVGLTREDVELLRQRHLRDIPHSDSLGLDTSFFTQAEIRYGGRIRLREHFRCMPEIIQFSNNLCYRSEPLVPLRQYGAGRLIPVIVTRHVPDGYQIGRSPRVVNPPEAEAIVEQIRKCCDDPSYVGKSLGVISLLGEDQARLIERRLLEKIGPEEMERRDLVCGEAYAFQGDERDVMFLSLVSAPGEGQRIGTLASPRDERRFNVAASRAKDQMWLVHTATLNDLSPQCLRYRLLQYCQNPHVELSPVEGLNLEAIQAMARSADRDRVTPPPPSPFESWFEVDVFLKIAERGYRVLPQLEIAGYYLDLVVEGMRGRLAVECDGDLWHGGDRYGQDIARQRNLERCGLTFWRVRGSAFYRDSAAALEGLWNTLHRLEIYPASGNMAGGSGSTPETAPPVSATRATQTREEVGGTSAGQKEKGGEGISGAQDNKGS
jgi:very-short-patch-repair endonuclease